VFGSLHPRYDTDLVNRTQSYKRTGRVHFAWATDEFPRYRLSVPDGRLARGRSIR